MNKKLYITLLFSVLSATAMLASAIELSPLATRIVANNPGYKAAVARAQAEIQSLRTENNLADPEVEVTHVWGESHVGNKLELSLSQSFDWPGAYSARKNAADAQALALDAQTRADLSALLLEVKLAMIDIINCRKRMELYQAALVRIDSLAAIVARDVEKKDVSVLDGNKLRIEHVAIARQLDDATIQYDEACIRLAGLNNGNEGLGDILALLNNYPDEDKLLPSSHYLELARANSPAAAYRNSLHNALLAKKNAAKKESFPGFSVGLTRQVEMGDKFNGFSVAMTLPFFSGRGKQKAIDSEIITSQLEQQSEEKNLDTEILATHTKAMLLNNQINEYGKVLNNTENFRLLNKALEARHITVLEYIGEFNYFTSAQNDYLELLYQYHTELIKLYHYASPGI